MEWPGLKNLLGHRRSRGIVMDDRPSPKIDALPGIVAVSFFAGHALFAREKAPWLPYVYGKADPEQGGFDCSGAMYSVMSKAVARVKVLSITHVALYLGRVVYRPPPFQGLRSGKQDSGFFTGNGPGFVLFFPRVRCHEYFHLPLRRTHRSQGLA